MLRGLLAPGGKLVILTVNAGSLHLAGLADRWQGFTRNHLMFYSRDTLPRLLSAAGFSRTSFASFYGDEAGACWSRSAMPDPAGAWTVPRPHPRRCPSARNAGQKCISSIRYIVE